MSKLTALIAIPLGLFALKRLQEQIKDEPTLVPLIETPATPAPTPEPLIKEGFVVGPAGTDIDIAPLFPDEKPFGDIPIFEDCRYGFERKYFGGPCVKVEKMGL